MEQKSSENSYYDTCYSIVRQTLLRGTVTIHTGTTAVGGCSRGERLDSALTTRKEGIIAKKWGLGGDGKVLRGNTRGQAEDSGYTNLTGFLLKAGQGGHTSPGEGGGWEPHQMLRMIRYRGWGILDRPI